MQKIVWGIFFVSFFGMVCGSDREGSPTPSVGIELSSVGEFGSSARQSPESSSQGSKASLCSRFSLSSFADYSDDSDYDADDSDSESEASESEEENDSEAYNAFIGFFNKMPAKQKALFARYAVANLNRENRLSLGVDLVEDAALQNGKKKNLPHNSLACVQQLRSNLNKAYHVKKRELRVHPLPAEHVWKEALEKKDYKPIPIPTAKDQKDGRCRASSLPVRPQK